MRAKSQLGVVCLVAVFGWASIAVAADGDVYSGGASFSFEERTKARDSPPIGASLAIPRDLTEGVALKVDCILEATKNRKGKPAKRVTGSLALFAISLDVGSGTWDFSGLVGSGIPFTTDNKGIAMISSGEVMAGEWATGFHPVNDFISAGVQLTNNKRVAGASIFCEIVR